MSLFSRFSFHTETCGVDVGKHTIRAAQLRAPHQHAGLVGVSEVALPAKIYTKDQISNLDQFTEAVQKLLQGGSPGPIKAKAAVAALPESFIFTRIIQLPNLPPHELQKAIPYEVGQFLPIPVEEVYFDYTPLALHPDKSQIDAALFAAPKLLVDNLVTTLHNCGLELYALETKSTAITRAFLPTHTIEPVLIIEIGSESTRLTVVDHGDVWLTASLNMGEGQLVKAIADKLSKPEAEVLPYLAAHGSDASAATLSSVVAPIIQEIVSVTRYHESRDFNAGKIHRAILTGQGAAIPGLVSALLGGMHIKGELGTPLVTGVNSIDPRYSVALGLSMRTL